jgi:hypothetical protein
MTTTVVQAESNTVTVVVNETLDRVSVVQPQTQIAIVRDNVVKGPVGPQGPQGPVGNSVFVSKDGGDVLTSNVLNFLNTESIQVQVTQDGANANISFITTGAAVADAYAQANVALDEANLKLNIAGGTITGSLNIDSGLNVAGDIAVGGNLIIGNVNTDTVQVIADFTSNLVPDVSNTYNLGADDKRWNELYVNEVNVSSNLIVTGNIISRNIIPDANITYDIGSPEARFRDLWLSNNTIHLGDAQISADQEDIVFNEWMRINGSSEIIYLGNLTLAANGFSLEVSDNSGNTVIINTVDKTLDANVVTSNTINVGVANTETLDVSQSANILGNLIVSGNVTAPTLNTLAIAIAGNIGSTGQVLTSNGAATIWASKYYYGDTPPDFDKLNYGDIFFYIDTPNNFSRMYMWVTDGNSEFFYDFLPPTF